VDQLSYVVQTLQKDLYSRQAVMSITDPTNDQFDLNGNLVETKDIPCCRIIQFMVVDGKLDCTSYFRSNDILFGMQQVNIFNNTFIQECVAMILNIPVGKYYHIANNLHYYEDKEDLIVNNFNKNKEEYVDSFQEWKGYGENFSLAEFDACIVMLFNYRDALSRSLSKGITATIPFENGGFFSDWAKVFYRFHSKDKNVHFLNPYLNKLFNNEQLEPNREYVKVKLKGKWKKFPVRIVKSYLKTCERDGKEAIYIGKTDKFGYLNK
jgi:thymidylate synthase